MECNYEEERTRFYTARDHVGGNDHLAAHGGGDLQHDAQRGCREKDTDPGRYWEHTDHAAELSGYERVLSHDRPGSKGSGGAARHRARSKPVDANDERGSDRSVGQGIRLPLPGKQEYHRLRYFLVRPG